MTINIDGLDELRKTLSEASADVQSGVARVVAETTQSVHGAAIRRLHRGPASGATYELYNPRRTHTASAPGQPPMSDTGRLANSVAYDIDGTTGTVFTPLTYGLYLEFGTGNGLQPRPWLLPSLEEQAPRFERSLRGLLR